MVMAPQAVEERALAFAEFTVSYYFFKGSHGSEGSSLGPRPRFHGPVEIIHSLILVVQKSLPIGGPSGRKLTEGVLLIASADRPVCPLRPPRLLREMLKRESAPPLPIRIGRKEAQKAQKQSPDPNHDTEITEIQTEVAEKSAAIGPSL
jgi:hypothetical protein